MRWIVRFVAYNPQSLPENCQAYETELNKLRLLFVLELLLPFNLFLYTLFCRSLGSVYDRAFYTV